MALDFGAIRKARMQTDTKIFNMQEEHTKFQEFFRKNDDIIEKDIQHSLVEHAKEPYMYAYVRFIRFGFDTNFAVNTVIDYHSQYLPNYASKDHIQEEMDYYMNSLAEYLESKGLKVEYVDGDLSDIDVENTLNIECKMKILIYEI